MTREDRREKKGILFQDLPAWIRVLRYLDPLVAVQLRYSYHAEEFLQFIIYSVRMGDECRQHSGDNTHPACRFLVRPCMDAYWTSYAVYHFNIARRGCPVCAGSLDSTVVWLKRDISCCVHSRSVLHEHLLGDFTFTHHRPDAGPRSIGRALTSQRRHQFHGRIRLPAGVLRYRQDLDDQQTAGVCHRRSVSSGGRSYHVSVDP